MRWKKKDLRWPLLEINLLLYCSDVAKLHFQPCCLERRCHAQVLPGQVSVSLHVSLVHLHRVERHATYLTHQGVGWRRTRVKRLKLQKQNTQDFDLFPFSSLISKSSNFYLHLKRICQKATRPHYNLLPSWSVKGRKHHG